MASMQNYFRYEFGQAVVVCKGLASLSFQDLPLVKSQIGNA